VALGFTGSPADAAQAGSAAIQVAATIATLKVASTRNEQPIGEQAVPVAMVGRSDIETRMLAAPGDTTTLFNGLPGLRVQSTSPVLGTTIARIQGLPGHYTRLLLAGVHLYGDRPGGYALPRIPPMDLDRVEIIKGPAGAFYGSDALSGSINLISRRPGSEPGREFLFNQSARGETDGLLWLSSPATSPTKPRTWTHTFLAGGHWQQENDVDDDGWSDIPGYARGTVRQRVFWENGRGRAASGVAGVTIETRDGGSAFARESLETKTADGAMFGQMVLDSGYIVGGAGSMFVQSRDHDFGDVRENERFQTATIEITLRRPGTRNSWLAAIASDWYAIRSDPLPTAYVSTRPGIFFHDDWRAASWLVLSGSLRADKHNLYGVIVSPRGSALVRRGPWEARVTAGQAYFTPRPLMEETEAAGLTLLTIEDPDNLKMETARNVSADFTHKTGSTALTVTVFRTRIDDPAQIDRTTYTLRSETEPILTRGVEVLGTARRPPVSFTGTYTYLRTRERDGRALALTPEHSASVNAAAEGSRGRIGVEVLYTGEQRLDANPYRTTSESYVVLGMLGELRFGQWRLFVTADNLTDVRQTDWDPIQRPERDVDGRWTVDAWAPLKGRVINGGIRVSF